MNIKRDSSKVKEGVWFVSDLHLTDREMSSTDNMAENSGRILDNILNTLIQDETIKVLILAGDIQHKIPTNRRLVTSWVIKLNQIKDVLLKRFPKEAVVYNNEEIVEEVNPLISLKGNHDIHKEGKYTFFDELEDLGVVGRYTNLVWKGVQYNLYDYGRAGEGLTNEFAKKDNVDKVVGLYHDAFAYEGCPNWMRDNIGNGVYDLSELEGIDVAVIGHIHDRIKPIKVSHETGETLFWQPGCIARTSYSAPNKRDEGYSALIDSDTLNLYAYDIPVVPYQQYFKTLTNDLKKERVNGLKEFSLNLSETVVNFNSYEDEIKEMDVDEAIKDKAIILIDDVQSK